MNFITLYKSHVKCQSIKHRRHILLFNSSETHIVVPQIQSRIWLRRYDVTTDHIYITARIGKSVFHERAISICFPNHTPSFYQKLYSVANKFVR